MGTRATVVAVNVPFARMIDEAELARALVAARPGSVWADHAERFLSELEADEILRFCDAHGVSKTALKATYAAFDADLKLGNRDLEEWLAEP
ncbi:hypothetical protein D3874_01115 [Oleomonas cavernae]|uniref:Uncharacterized protein n=1 Tax=Oleomonas cavernae TaxID=2320859 RepID=A0A418WTH6_9PROT|nr:hypothetical protein [Oleomonas cavernae]RJF94469.1 hypothetical protein D3874_01115 [Oleomonas cavernae]